MESLNNAKELVKRLKSTDMPFHGTRNGLTLNGIVPLASQTNAKPLDTVSNISMQIEVKTSAPSLTVNSSAYSPSAYSDISPVEEEDSMGNRVLHFSYNNAGQSQISTPIEVNNPPTRPNGLLAVHQDVSASNADASGSGLSIPVLISRDRSGPPTANAQECIENKRPTDVIDCLAFQSSAGSSKHLDENSKAATGKTAADVRNPSRQLKCRKTGHKQVLSSENLSANDSSMSSKSPGTRHSEKSAKLTTEATSSPSQKAPKAKKSCHPTDEMDTPKSPAKVSLASPTTVTRSLPPTIPASPSQTASSGFGTVLLTELGKDLGIEGQSIDKLDGRTIDQMILAKLRNHLRPSNSSASTPIKDRNDARGLVSPSRLSPRTHLAGRCRKRVTVNFFIAAVAAKTPLTSPSSSGTVIASEMSSPRLLRNLSSVDAAKSRSPDSPRLRSSSSARVDGKSANKSNNLEQSDTDGSGRGTPGGSGKRRRLKRSNWARGTIPKAAVVRKKFVGEKPAKSSQSSKDAECCSSECDENQPHPMIKRKRVGSSPVASQDYMPRRSQETLAKSEVKPEEKLKRVEGKSEPLSRQTSHASEVEVEVEPCITEILEEDRSQLLATNRQWMEHSCFCRSPALVLPMPALTTFPMMPCQAVDSIDGKNKECLAKVTKAAWVRPSATMPLMLLCNHHLQLLDSHRCCPSCGVFCTQGSFLQCRKAAGTDASSGDSLAASPPAVVHYFHEDCQLFVNNKNLCPHCGGEVALHEVGLRLTEPCPVPCISMDEILKLSAGEQRKTRAPRARIGCGGSGAQRSKLRGTAQPAVGGSVVSETSSSASHSTKRSTDRGSAVRDRRELDLAMSALDKERMRKVRVCLRSLMTACRLGDTDKVLYMISEGLDVNQHSDDGQSNTALHVACRAGHHQIVNFLLMAGAQVDECDADLRTPLMEAVEQGHVNVIEMLLSSDALADRRSRDGMTLLHIAAKSGQTAAIRLLLERRKLDVNAKDDGGWTPVVWAAEHRNGDAVQYLLSKGADAGVRDNEYNTGLHWAAYAGSCQIAEIFIAAGCDVNSPNEHGDCPLHIAARQDHADCVMLLLRNGANVDVRNLADDTPLMSCIEPNGAVGRALQLARFLRPIARRVERLVDRDISRGRELIPIHAVNAVDSSGYPADFVYVTDYIETMPIFINRIVTSVQSCQCDDKCSSAACMCASQSIKCWYDQEGRLSSDFNYADPPLLFECNRSCRCYTPCTNRVVQLGIQCRLQVFKTEGRGWGVRSLTDIPRGTFICEYAGELITDAEADQREDDSYLFDLDNLEADTFCIDASRYGNVSRFINHLCEPNLVPVKVFVEHQDLRFPRMCFFAARDIAAKQELGFDYGSKFWVIKWKKFTCCCASAKCRYSKDTIAATLEEYNRRQQQDESDTASSVAK